MKKIFLAGAVTDKQDYKTYFSDAIQRLTDALLDKEVLIVTPALLFPDGFDYEAYVRMGIAMLSECDSICLLPGWEASKGASAEYQVAKALNKEILYFDNFVK